MNLSQIRLHTHFIAQFGSRLTLAAVHLLVGVVMAWFALRYYPGDRWMPVQMGSYFAPWLFIALFPAFLIAFIAGRRWLLRLVMVLIMTFLIQYWSILIPNQPYVQARSNRSQLRVMTFNVNFTNRNASGIAELIQVEAPDIVAFQEMSGELFTVLRPQLHATHPYYLVDKSWELHMVLISRYPLTALSKPLDAIRAQHALVETPDGAVVIWNVHPNPAIAGGWEPQRQLLASVAENIAQESRPVIVLGDFNTTDQTENYQLFADQLTDVQWVVGQGFGFTFPDFSRAKTPDQPWHIQLLLGIGPMIKIDHIFVSHPFVPQETHIVQHAYGSDHRPVVATLLAR